MAIRLVTLNMERDKHLDRVYAFLEREQPDVACLQEVFEEDAARLARLLGASYTFLPMVYQKRHTGEGYAAQGVAILSRMQVLDEGGTYYHRSHPEDILYYVSGTALDNRANMAMCFVYVDVVPFTGASEPVRIITTHFTWSPNGLIHEHQKQDMEVLLYELSRMGEFVLTGDFNVPRGYNEIYDILADRFTDEVPRHFETSLDLTLHRVRDMPEERERLSKYMVDYIFTTDAYRMEDVSLRFGLSDHAAVVGVVRRATPEAAVQEAIDLSTL